VAAAHLSHKVNVALQPEFGDLPFQRRALPSLADNPAQEVETLGAEKRTGLDQESIILYLVKTPDRQQTKRTAAHHGRGRRGRPRKNAIHAEPLKHNFFRRHEGIIAEDVAPVEVRDSDTKPARTQLSVQQVGSSQQ